MSIETQHFPADIRGSASGLVIGFLLTLFVTGIAFGEEVPEVFDRQGRLVERGGAEPGAIASEYDESGKLVRQRLENGDIVAYDEDGNVVVE